MKIHVVVHVHQRLPRNVVLYQSHGWDRAGNMPDKGHPHVGMRQGVSVSEAIQRKAENSERQAF